MAELIAAAVVGAMTALLQALRGRGHPERRLSAKLELYLKLPEASASRELLLAHIDAGVRDMVEVEAEHRRDPVGVSTAVGLVVTGGLLSWLALRGGWWWLILAPGSFFVLLGIAGFGFSITKRKRESNAKSR